ncbi:MAG: DUF1152 domain-containing protein [Armatimonadetes bacterium]|nr:DUF1152 domain-containing protein [Armatimonadota bacterium]
MDLATAPLFQRLAGARRIMVSGAGGGHDVYVGLPLYLYLRSRAEAVFLGSMSFADLGSSTGTRITQALTRIDADTEGSEEYFPERALSRWFRTRGEDVPVYCFQRTGVVTLSTAWRTLADRLRLDAVILADGGTDSLMRGDEVGLGTPQEDLASIAAVHSLDLPCKIVSCLGFGIDTFDEVCHAQFLESVAALQRKGGFLGAFSLLPQMEEARLFLEAVDYAVEAMPGAPSVVSGSIASALEGYFGDHHRTWRTSGNRLFISPLMSMYWSFDLDAVARRCLYIKELCLTESYRDVDRVVQDFRKRYPPMRGWEHIPY